MCCYVWLQVYNLVGVSPSDQHLYAGDDEELAGADVPLSHLGVLPEALLWLVADQATASAAGGKVCGT